MSVNYTTNTYFNPSNKNIKLYECAVIATEQAYIAAKLNLNNLTIPYDTFFVSKMKIEKSTTKPVMYGFLGNLVTTIIIKVNYNLSKPCFALGDNYMTYYFQGEENIIRPIGNFMWLTSNKDHKLPQMYITNPSTENDIEIEIMVANIETADNTIINAPDNNTKINDLYFNSIITDIDYANVGTGSTEFRVLDVNDNIIQTIVFEQINYISKTNNSIDIRTDSDQYIQLNFLSEFHANQALSRMSYILNDNYNRYLTKSSPNIDTTSPNVIFYSGATDYMSLSTGISFSDITNHFIDYIIDYDDSNIIRDGFIDKSLVEVVATKLSGYTSLSGISEYGEYNVSFIIKDKASNKTTANHILIVDGIEPIIYYKNISRKFNLNGDGISGGTAINSDFRNFYINNVYDNLDGVIPNSNVNVVIYSGITAVSSITTVGNYNILYSVNDRAMNVCSAITSTIVIDSPQYYYNVSSSGNTMDLNTGITKTDIIDYYILDVIDEYNNLTLGKYNVDCKIYDSGSFEINDISIIGLYTITFEISDSMGYNKLVSVGLNVV